MEKTMANDKPNFIVFMTDDQGYGDLGSYGSKTIVTPNIDQLAVEGAKFTDFYVHLFGNFQQFHLLYNCLFNMFV